MDTKTIKENKISHQNGEKEHLNSSKQTEDQINKALKKPLKYNISGISFILIFSISMSVHIYHIVSISSMTQKIQGETPLKGIVKSWFGFWRDDSDNQWREFRRNLILFIPGMLIFVFLGRLIKTKYEKSPEKKFQALIYYYLITGCCFLSFLFEGGFITWIFFTASNYIMQKFLYKYKIYPIILWTYSIWSLYYIYFYHNQPFEILTQFLPSLGAGLQESSRTSQVAWYSVQNMTMLRVMSFCMDRHWSFRKQYQFNEKTHLERCESCPDNKICLKQRTEKYLEPKEYDSILNYYSYLMYLPLFITGPQVTFNAFISQVKTSQNFHSNKTIIIYFIRALGKLMEIELYSHLTFVNALSKFEQNKHHWLKFSIIQCLFMGLLVIFFIWLKFLAIWRLARSFSLLDGIDCPENMVQCLFTGTGFEEFWRSWHRGFNQWLIRYLFIPLGGSKTKVWNVWIVFTFVAIWHDFQLDLVVWAWFICLSLIPEILVKKWANASKQDHLWRNWWFKYVCVSCGAVMIWVMMLGNLIGFGSGWENSKLILSKISEPGAITQVIVAWFSTLSYTALVFYIRDRQAETLWLNKKITQQE